MGSLKMEFEITWEIEDGYCGGSRPQHLKIDLDNFDQDTSLQDIERILEDLIQEDFTQTVSWFSGDYKDAAQEIFNALQAENPAED